VGLGADRSGQWSVVNNEEKAWSVDQAFLNHSHRHYRIPFKTGFPGPA